jgi:cation diffusion facilitator CzcD-associated flavoprotein CzcO
MSTPNVIIVGGGAAAIAMAHTLKHKLGFNNFEAYVSTFPLWNATNNATRSLRSAKDLEVLGGSTPIQDGTFPLSIPVSHRITN